MGGVMGGIIRMVVEGLETGIKTPASLPGVGTFRTVLRVEFQGRS
jgi:hypothetical protein